jgi:hypothetical protein
VRAVTTRTGVRIGGSRGYLDEKYLDMEIKRGRLLVVKKLDIETMEA